jgi:hypothetical protein
VAIEEFHTCRNPQWRRLHPSHIIALGPDKATS